MTDLPIILPEFPTRPYTHLLPSLDRHGITVADLLSLDTLEIAKRASLPILDLRKLAHDVVYALHGALEVSVVTSDTSDELFSPGNEHVPGKGKISGLEIVKRWSTISFLDTAIDKATGGGIPTGYLTEITGESAAGKTQFLLTLLLSAQLSAPWGISRSSIYISTEAPLSTIRLAQLLESHPRLSQLAASKRPSLARVYAIPVQDLESQDHILAFQLPHAIRKFNVGLVVLDSVAANYRAEHGSAIPKDLANRAARLARLGKLLRDLARQENIAVVVANQVSDRFEEVGISARQEHPRSSSPKLSSSPAPPNSQGASLSSAENAEAILRQSVLSLDFQQRFFTGWGDEMYGCSSEGLKTPALGLAWTNQIACRIALKMETCRATESATPTTNNKDIYGYQGGNIWKDTKKRRFLRLVFAPWEVPTLDPVEYEIRPEGISGCDANGKVGKSYPT